MVRDFSESMKQRLLRLVHDVSSDAGFDRPDGDMFADLLSDDPTLNFQDDDVEIDTYYQTMIDRECASTHKIEAIFDAVSAEDHVFATQIDAMESSATMVVSALWRL